MARSSPVNVNDDNTLSISKCKGWWHHYSDVTVSAMTSRITNISPVCLTVCPGAHQRKHQSSASLAFVRGIHHWPADSTRKEPVTWNMFPFDDVIMCCPPLSAKKGALNYNAFEGLCTRALLCFVADWLNSYLWWSLHRHRTNHTIGPVPVK